MRQPKTSEGPYKNKKKVITHKNKKESAGIKEGQKNKRNKHHYTQEAKKTKVCLRESLGRQHYKDIPVLPEYKEERTDKRKPSGETSDGRGGS